MIALCACWATFCATCSGGTSTPPPPRFERLPPDRLLLRLLVLRLLLRRPEELPERLDDDDRLDDLRPRDDEDRDEEPRDEERADEPPRFRAADFRPLFEPPDRRDELLRLDFLRDPPRLEVAIPGFPRWKKLRHVHSKNWARMG